MPKWKRNTFIISSFVLLLAGGLYWVLHSTAMVETIKKETAKLLVYEYIPNQNLVLESRKVFLQKDSVYVDFRKKYRFHFQTVALAQFDDSSKLILITEPPPHFVIDSIKAICSQFTHSVETKTHPMGYDGRVTDILLLLANATTENVHNLIARLSKELYFSDYKPQVTSLPAEKERVYFTKSNVDYRISLDEFDQWFIKEEESFMLLDDTTHTETIQTIFDKQKQGVFFSRLPGFVAWAIPKNSDLSEQMNYIRQFTLDADLILGALADSATLVIIGREREAPLNELPPLHVESILLLASITEKELSQSLDINDLMAGKMSNGKDWCPTYLSKELENTEFGHLLTITDILLKDWSERGTIEELYYRYPKPKYYPFDKPLFKKLGLHELVYNWNTANAMYAIDLEKVTIYTLNRTGSLPVSYFNSQERSVSIGRKYENQAYHYFATLGNTDLARVVQYTALYQLFIDNGITYSGDVHTAFPKNKPYLLQKPASNLMTVFKNLTDAEIDFLSDTLSKIQFAAYQKEKVLKQIKENEQQYNYISTQQHKETIFTDVNRNTKEQLSNELVQTRGMLRNLSDDDFRKLAQQVAYPRGKAVRNREDYALWLKGRQLNKLTWTIGKNYLYLFHVDLNDVKNYYVRNLASSSARYLKTPSVIITFNDMLTTGGHNLSSKISRVTSTTNYKQSAYVPQDYTPTADVPPEQTPVSAQPTLPVSKVSKPSSTDKPKSTTTSSSPTTPKQTVVATMGKSTTRSRNEVISSAARMQRGL
jgi:hypothetical protein